MITREATFEDFEALVPIAREVHSHSLYAEFPMNEAFMQRNFVISLAFDDGFVRIMEHKGKVIGGMVGVISENHFGIRCAQDLFTFSKGGTNLLLKEFREWALGRGAKFVYIADLCGKKRYHEMLKCLGFQPGGSNFIGVA